MKLKLLFLLPVFGVVVALSLYFSFPSVSAQTTNQVKMYLNSSSLNVQTGASLSVPIYLDTNSASINAVQSDINYPKNLLAIESINASSSAFPLEVVNKAVDGHISIVRGSFSPIKGNNLLIAVINFKAIAPGSASLTFLESSAAVNSPVDSLTSSPPLTLTISSVPTPAPSKTPLPSPSPKGSVIKIYAAGVPALNVYPSIQLQVKNTQGQWVGVKSWNNIKGNHSTRQFMEFIYNHPTKIMPNTIRVRFTNDYYNPAQNQDRNLIIDKINLDGMDFHSESQTTLSQGSWNPAAGCKEGFKKSEWLQCPGFFQY